MVIFNQLDLYILNKCNYKQIQEDTLIYILIIY